MDQDRTKLIADLTRVTALACFAQCLTDFKQLVREMPVELRPEWKAARVIFRETVQDVITELATLQQQEVA